MSDKVQELKKKRDKLKAIADLKQGLPHLYAFPMYKWQEEFWNRPNRFQFIFKANQIGGSSVMIRRMIHYATEQSLWTRFKRKPTMMLYLYPDKKSATREWLSKWAEFMPRNEYKDHEKYGWHETWDGNYIDSITFYDGRDKDGKLKDGLTIFFKTYGSGADTLQASTPAIVACDEELPFDLWPELQMRIASPANEGAMYWQGCTPTLGQKYLADIQSGTTKIPDSWVVTVSMYDCLKLANGDKSIWTVEKIEQIKQTLPNEREIQVRVYGLFKPADELAITQFDSKKHVVPFHIIKGWDFYTGIDYGVGGPTGHPSAITVIAVNPDYTQARVYKCKRYDKEQTTPDDVVYKHIELLSDNGINEGVNSYYDHSCGSIGIISERQGLGYHKANKDRAAGFGIIDSLFKNDMLLIMDDGSGEPDKLVEEIESLRSDHDKKRAGDDLVDSLRYALSSIPFNFSHIKAQQIKETPQKVERVGRHTIEKPFEFDDIGDEIDEWNECYG